MNVWSHHPTIFSRRLVKAAIGLTMLCVAITTTLFLANNSGAAPTTNKTINFQARLLSSSGAVVPDGHYNIQFKIYEGGSGSALGNPNGDLKWTESYVNDGSQSGVRVKNGFLAVNLGSVTSFGSSVDWNADTIWLSMNVAGRDPNCSQFGEGNCESDGEMLPMKRITATPFAINSSQLGGLTANNFLQLAQGVQTDSSSNTTSIFLNKTGSGNLMQFQNNGSDVFTIGNNGNLILGGNADKTISVGQSSEGLDGRSLAIAGGSGGAGTGSTGGDLLLQGGVGGGTNGNGGNVVLGGGKGTAGGVDGLVVLTTPALATTNDDANCFTSGNLVSGSCTISQSSVDGSSAIMVGFDQAGRTATLPDPTNQTAGRLIYVVAASGSSDFKILANGGSSSTNIKANKAVTFLWNGSDWASVGASDQSSLQDAYQNSVDKSETDELTVDGTNGSGVTIRDDDTNPVSGSILEVKNSENTAILSVGSDNLDGLDAVSVGDGSDSTAPTLLTVDKGSSAPEITDEALLGSMYYDTTLGKIQCYEAEGWGNCGESPDSFISMSPEFSNAVISGNGEGVMDSEFCSDVLNINDGSSGQPTICGENETQNFYRWTTDQASAQTKSIFVDYQLPDNFDSFIANSTSLKSRTDSANATVSYQLYRKTASGLEACGSSVLASTGGQTAWHDTLASGANDPANCGFVAGDSLVVRIDATALVDAHAYISNFNFAHSVK